MTTTYNTFELAAYPRIAVWPSDERFIDAASKIAKELNLPIPDYSTGGKDLSNFDFFLEVSNEGLILRQFDSKLKFSINFSDNSIKYRVRSNRSELLGRAIGVKNDYSKHVVDGTAGFGTDSFILASLGCSVTLCERNSVIAEMLGHAIESAKNNSERWLAESASRMSLVRNDLRALSLEVLDHIDAIYLDPMFPQKKNNAASRKEIELLKSLQSPEVLDFEHEDLLEWALNQKVGRVVYKRPIRSKPVGNISPSHQLFGRIIRYDVYQISGKESQ